MAITHTTTVRNGIADYVVDLLDVGGIRGSLQFRTGSDPAVGGAEVATLLFTHPGGGGAFGAASNGTATANAITGDSDATGGTVGHFVAFSAAGDSCFAGTVTLSGGGGDIFLSSLAVGATDTVEITSLTYTAPN